MSRRVIAPLLVLAALTALLVVATGAASGGAGSDRLARINHIVVIYEENHSFDNLYGRWEGVNGVAKADAAHTTQLSQASSPFACLKQDDVNLTSPPLAATCTDTTVTPSFASNFTNGPFTIGDFIKPADTTCPQPFQEFARANGWLKGQGTPGGCTRDLVHRYYQEQYQLNGGNQNRYVTGSDAIGLTMGVYDTTALPVYRYLHAGGSQKYAIADDFFQSAFGGSFLNHQWLIAAATPVWPGALNDASANDLHSVVDVNGMPNNYPLYASPLGSAVVDRSLTASCSPPAGRPPTPPGVVCGNFAVNTTQPAYQPIQPGTNPARLLPPQTAPTIGDRLSAAGADWAWYSGGWSNANGDVGAPGWTNGNGPTCSDSSAFTTAVFPNCPDHLFQFHHQPFNYFFNYRPGTAARGAHLRDEVEFLQLADGSAASCKLKPVSFVKPIGQLNEHPGYTGEDQGSSHLVKLLRAIEGGDCAKDTMVVVTYDEFGGSWDHVPPPGQGGTPGPHDIWGPGTRIPTLVVSPFLRGHYVIDHTQYDTTSILATIERRWGLAPLTSRDAVVNDLSNVFDAKEFNNG